MQNFDVHSLLFKLYTLYTISASVIFADDMTDIMISSIQ